MKDDLKAALGREDYEQAAELRDQIQMMEAADDDE